LERKIYYIRTMDKKQGMIVTNGRKFTSLIMIGHGLMWDSEAGQHSTRKGGKRLGDDVVQLGRSF
jgi:hypothetical protein